MIQVGQIWQVATNDFWSSKKSDKVYTGDKKTPRKAIVNLDRDEFIEIRYPFAWHFRTVDGIYLHADPVEIMKNCRLFGTICEDIRFGNRHKLQQILDEKLYKAVWEESEVEG
jgi:hypothetical protein